MKRIFVNGREYRSIDEMPPEVRRIYEARAEGEDPGPEAPRGAAFGPPEEDGEGSETTVVEIDRSEIRPDPTAGIEGRTETRIVVDGREYSDPEELPPRARELYEFMMSRIGGDAPVRGGLEGPASPDSADRRRIEVSESGTTRHVHRVGPAAADRSGPESDGGPHLVWIVSTVLLILFVISLLT